jgi:hypothetical protein
MSKPDLSGNTRTVHSFLEAINRCTLPHVPQTTRRLLSTGAWRERFEGGRIIRFDDFYQFVTEPFAPKGGCGLQTEKVTELLRKAEDAEVLEMWLTAIRAKDAQEIDAKTPDLKSAHRPKKGNITENDVTLSRRGNDPAYALARLRKDRPDIHARVLAGELTAHAGMIEAGFRKKRPSRKLTLLQKIRRMISKLSESELEELIQDLVRERKKGAISKDQLAMFQ